MDSRYFTKKLAQWYQQNKRELPWRETKDPYLIWLSEIILQQTRVIQGLPYYKKLIEVFPTVHELANATEQQILRLWQGLGYYSRARNLHKCAKRVMADYNGQFPSNFMELKKLPGIGDYTAAAIASIAFGESVAVVDGNVFRVLSRVFGIDTPINSPAGKKIFFELANTLIPKENPDLFNQGIMEFGALHCTPKNPGCTECIFKSTCIAQKNNLQGVLPVKTRSKKIKKRYFYYFVIQNGKSLLMKRRGEKDIWQGLYDFYLVEKRRSYDPLKIFNEDPLMKKLRAQTKSPQDLPKQHDRLLKENLLVSNFYKHVLSHQVIFSRFIQLKTRSKNVNGSGLTIYSQKKISQLPKPVLISRFLKDYELL